MTSLFSFSPESNILAGNPIKAQDVLNLQNFCEQIVGFVLQDGSHVTGVTTVNIGANMSASGSAGNGITLWNNGIVVNSPTGNGSSGAIFSFLNGANMSISGNATSIIFNATGSGNGGGTTGVTIVDHLGNSILNRTKIVLTGGIKAVSGSAGEIFLSVSGTVDTGSNSALTFPAIYTNIYVGLKEQIKFTTNYTMSGAIVYFETAPISSGTIIEVFKDNSSLGTITIATSATEGQLISSQSLIKGSTIKFVVNAAPDIAAGNPMYFGVF